MISYEKVTIKPCNVDDLKYIWENMRDVDKEEFINQGLNSRNYEINMINGWIGYYDGMPIVWFDRHIKQDCVWLMFCSTDESSKYWDIITDYALTFIESVKTNHPYKRLLIVVQHNHRLARFWISKTLRFKQVNKTTNNNVEFLIYEKKGDELCVSS